MPTPQHDLKDIGLAYSKEAYRVIYVAIFSEAVYVLHAFQKKYKTGRATPLRDLDLGARRYRELVRERLQS
jgi:phage-related protein